MEIHRVRRKRTHLDICSFGVHQFRDDFAQFFCIGKLSGWCEHHIRNRRRDWTSWTGFSCFLWRTTESGNLFFHSLKEKNIYIIGMGFDKINSVCDKSWCRVVSRRVNQSNILAKFTCSAVFSKFSISKLLVRLVCFPLWMTFCGSADEGAGELSTSGENMSLPTRIEREHTLIRNICFCSKRIESATYSNQAPAQSGRKSFLRSWLVDLLAVADIPMNQSYHPWRA